MGRAAVSREQVKRGDRIRMGPFDYEPATSAPWLDASAALRESLGPQPRESYLWDGRLRPSRRRIPPSTRFSPGAALGVPLRAMFAWVYIKTSRVHLVFPAPLYLADVLPVLRPRGLLVMSNNLVIGPRPMAVFAIVRFRNVLRDNARHLLCARGDHHGHACGTQKFSTAILVARSARSSLWWMTAAGTRHRSISSQRALFVGRIGLEAS